MRGARRGKREKRKMKLWINKCDGRYYLQSAKDSNFGVQIPEEWGGKIMGKIEGIVPVELAIAKNIKESLEDRAENFKKKCEEFIPKYGKPMVYKFVYYWSESNGKKMRWEMQEVFDISRRMAYWYNREKERGTWQKPQQAPQPKAKSVDDLIFKYENGEH